MIFIPTEHLTPGMVLAKDIYFYSASPFSMPLLTKGQELTPFFIEKIKSRDISGAYIENKMFDDIVVNSVISEGLRSRAMSDIMKVFKSYQANDENSIEQSIEKIRSLAKNLVLSILSNDKVLINLIDLKSYDDYTFSHSLCVAILSVSIGVTLGFNERQLNEIALSALLHDLGKLDVPIDIINKPDRLTDDEYAKIKGHPQNGVNRLSAKNLVSPYVISGVISHHEKCDGTGYPSGLKASQIPLYGKILAVADVYDALTSNRPYRKALFPSDAIEYMMGCSDIHFDQEILVAFLKNVAAYPVGTFVTLSNGKTAIVVKNLPDDPLRPIIRLLDANCTATNDINLLSDPEYMCITITGMGYDSPDINFASLATVDDFLKED